MKKVLSVSILILAVCLYGATAWSLVSDYSKTFLDDGGVPGDLETSNCNFINGFDLVSAQVTASDASDSITVTVNVATIVGNGNPSSNPGNALCTDNNPMVDCGTADSGGPCNNLDAPDGATDPADETYQITLCQPPVGSSGCDGAALVVVKFRPADTGGNNVATEGSSVVTVSPTNIDMTNSANWTNSFTITVSNLKAAGFNFAQPWGIKFFANSLVDGPGEDVFGGQVSPPPPELSCTKSFDKSQVSPGDTITATVTISNTGGSDTAVQINDTLDSGLSYVAGSTKVNGVAAADPSISGQTLTWNGINAAIGNTVVTYEISVDSIDPLETLCNSVVVISQDFAGIATSCQACVTRPGPPSLTCTKSFDKSEATPGTILTATVVISNSGASSTVVEIKDTLDSGLSYVAGSAKLNGSSTGDPSISGQVLTWSGVNVPVGSVTLTYEISVDSISAGQTLCNNVVVTSQDFAGISTQCSDCVTMPREFVPGMTNMGALMTALLMVLAAGIFMYRRRHDLS